MNTLRLLGIAWLIAIVAQTLAWAWQQHRRDAGIVDVVWAACLGGAAIVCAIGGEGDARPRLALAVLGGAWAMRLAVHLARRVFGGDAEDGRYAALRARWGDGALRWFGLFQLQALLVPLFALPFVAAAGAPARGHGAWELLAAAIWLVSVGGEAVADRQLARFRADPANRGRTCRDGLWRYSRHPNYFFEWLHWFTYVALAVGSPLAWLAWAGPLVMYGFLRWISGIPFTEAQALRTRGEDYRAYQRSTPMLFPWFPRSPS